MAKKRQYKNVYLNKHFHSIVDSFIEMGLPIEVGLGKYSSYVLFKDSNIKFKFISKFHSKLTFVGYAKILKDLKRPEISVLLSDLQDSIKEDSNIYYSTGKFETCSYPNAVCFDLNSAYLQALLNLGLITESTKDWIDTKLTKTERLVCVGMLAKRKEIVHFNNGVIQQDYVNESDKRFIFNAAIQEVARVMQEVKAHFESDFIAYWVDGIYMQNEFNAFEMQMLFEKNGFPVKVEEITDFQAKFKFDSMEYRYFKDGEPKIIRMPIASVYKEIKKNVVDVLNRKRREQGLSVEIDVKMIEERFVKQAQIFENLN